MECQWTYSEDLEQMQFLNQHRQNDNFGYLCVTLLEFIHHDMAKPFRGNAMIEKFLIYFLLKCQWDVPWYKIAIGVNSVHYNILIMLYVINYDIPVKQVF